MTYVISGGMRPDPLQEKVNAAIEAENRRLRGETEPPTEPDPEPEPEPAPVHRTYRPRR